MYIQHETETFIIFSHSHSILTCPTNRGVRSAKNLHDLFMQPQKSTH